MTLDQEDIKAIADEVLKRLLPYLEKLQPLPTTDRYLHQVRNDLTAEPDIEYLKQRAFELARQGKRQESIDLMKSISKLCRKKPLKQRQEEAHQRLEVARAARRQGELDDQDIRAASEKMPPDLRPHPDQYKSLSRKKQVLKMVQDPTRWTEIQWSVLLSQ